MTYHEPATRTFKGPWTPDRFATVDFFLVNIRWKNTVTNIESHPEIAFNSDHALVVADFRVKLKRTDRPVRQEKVERYRKPNEDQLKSYNAELIHTYNSLLHHQYLASDEVDVDNRMD